MQNFMQTFKAIHAQAKRNIESEMVLDFACEHDKAVLKKFAMLWAEQFIIDADKIDFTDSECHAIVIGQKPYDDYEYHILRDALLGAIQNSIDSKAQNNITKEQAVMAATNKKLKAALLDDDLGKARQIASKVNPDTVIYQYLNQHGA